MLTAKQNRLIAALATGGTIKSACRRARVGVRSYCDWKAESEFEAALSAAYRATLQASIGEMKGLTRSAVVALRRLLRSKRDAVRLRAVKLVLDQAVKGAELDDVLRRIAALEGAKRP
jgi:hypothetical protein